MPPALGRGDARGRRQRPRGRVEVGDGVDEVVERRIDRAEPVQVRQRGPDRRGRVAFGGPVGHLTSLSMRITAVGYGRCMESIDEEHSRPAGASDALVAAAGAMSEAFERVERARGALYTFHQLTGGADAQLDEVVEGLRDNGFADLADRVSDELIGLNALAGRWTFQIVEEFDDGYYATFRALNDAVREQTMLGRRHVFEAELKQRRRTRGRPGHEATPHDT